MSGKEIYGPPPQRLYESMDDDPAKIAEEKAKADYEAKTKPFCDSHADQIPCATPPKDATADGTKYQDLAKTMSAPKPAPSTPKPAPTPPSSGLLPNTNDSTRTTDADDGVVADAGRDGLSFYAGVTFGKDTSASGTQLEGPGASAQVGLSTELQVKTFRITEHDGADTTVEEGPSAKFTAGFGKNDDGSIGYHGGASASFGGAQLTHEGKNASFTVGVSEGVGGGVSAGVKPMEGGLQLCGQLNALFFTVGGCWNGRM